MKTYHMAKLETAQDELLDMIVILLREATQVSEPPDSLGYACCDMGNANYEEAFELLEKHGRLTWHDERRHFARLYTTEEVRP